MADGAKTVCSGRGDTDGGHCCYINGEVCEFLTTNTGTPRCSLWTSDDRLYDSRVWQASPVGEWFAVTYPGFDCKDWPQNIPEAMAGRGLCCWNPPVEVSIS